MTHLTVRSENAEAGFTLMELMIIVSILLVLTLVAIPNFAGLKLQANETSTIQSLRNVYQAENDYQAKYPTLGFACSMGAMGGDPKSGPATPQAAEVLQRDVASGHKSGYIYTITNCTKGSGGNQDVTTSYEVTAVPETVGKTGHRGFCLDPRGIVTADPKGGTDCTQALQ
jgi:type IV pilus assembly protein PilA